MRKMIREKHREFFKDSFYTKPRALRLWDCEGSPYYEFLP